MVYQKLFDFHLYHRQQGIFTFSSEWNIMLFDKVYVHEVGFEI